MPPAGPTYGSISLIGTCGYSLRRAACSVIDQVHCLTKDAPPVESVSQTKRRSGRWSRLDCVCSGAP